MNNIKKRLNELEEKVIPEKPEGPTYLDFNFFPKAEQELHIHAQNLAKKPFESLTEADLSIIDRSYNLLTYRVLRLFYDAMTAPLKDDFDKGCFAERLMWFVSEMYTMAHQRMAEEAIISDDSLTEAQKDEKLKPLYEKWHTPFTPESWDAYYKEHVEPIVKKSLESMPDDSEDVQNCADLCKPEISLNEALCLDKKEEWEKPRT